MKNRNKKDGQSLLNVDETSINHQWTIIEQSINMRPSIDQQSINIDQISILYASGLPVAFLDAFWTALGAAWRLLGGKIGLS